MILDTKAAKTVLSTMAFCLLLLAAFVAITGWDGISRTATAEKLVVQSTPSPAIVSKPAPEIIRPTPTPQETPVAQPEPTPTPQANPVVETTPVLPSSGIYISPPSQKGKPGEEISINVEAKIADCGISASEITLEFDPAALQIVELNAGNALGANPLKVEGDNGSNGILRYALARIGPTEATPSSGTLATVKFRITDSATSGLHDLKLTKINLIDEKGKEIAGLKIQNGSIEVAW